MLWVREYGSIYRGEASRNLQSGELELSTWDFDSVLTVLEERDTSELNTVFRYYRNDGVDCLRVQNYVGVIRTDNECQIEILPKTSKNMGLQSAQNLLVKMLVELQGSPFKRGTVADLQAHKMSLLENLLRYFLEQVTNIVRQGIARSYVDVQDNLAFLRGKLQLTEHLKQNMFQGNRFYCEFDEFEANRPINRLVKRALEVVQRESRDRRNLQHCRELLFWFDRVPSSTDIVRDFRAVRQDRLVQHYAPAMPTCRLILEGLNPLTRGGENRTISLLFDMNTVFQDYVVAMLAKQFPDWDINAQVRGYHLVERFNGKPHFGLVPDVELCHKRNSSRAIADCKWKLLDDAESNWGISRSDMYQLYAYCQKCLPSQVSSCVFLIYPKTDKFSVPLGPFYFDKNATQKLYALPFDLEQDRLVTDADNMFDEQILELAA